MIITKIKSIKSIHAQTLLIEPTPAVLLSRWHFSIEGGRGLPLSELPSCPGRFVLRGTCGGPSNAARSRHNVRAALGAFKALGGIPGARLRSEEAILDGDHEVRRAVSFPARGLIAVFKVFGFRQGVTMTEVQTIRDQI